MKISNISKLICACALMLSLNAVADDKKNNLEEKESTKSGSINAALYKISDTNKVRLSVDKNPNEKMRILLKDKVGKIYYSEILNGGEEKYRRVFNLEEMNDGTYYFEMMNKKNKVVKEIEIQSVSAKTISLQ